MAILDAPGFFRNTILPIVGQMEGHRRVPFTFTSTKRLLESGKLKAVGNNAARKLADQDNRRAIGEIESATRGLNVASQLGLSDVLSAVLNGAQQTVGFDGMPIVSMAINPQTITWTQNKRISKRDTMEGSVFFHFTNSAEQNNDILTMRFSGKTGNINTRATFLDTLATGASLKLRVWHELYSMTRETMLLNKENTTLDLPSPLRNEFYITYRTLLMPVQITLIGFFSKVMDFSESAADPFNRDYSFEFTVIDTSPSLDTLVSAVNTSLTAVGQLTSLSENGYKVASSLNEGVNKIIGG